MPFLFSNQSPNKVKYNWRFLVITRLSHDCEQYIPHWYTNNWALCAKEGTVLSPQRERLYQKGGQSVGRQVKTADVSVLHTMLARFFYNVTSADATREHPCENGRPGRPSHALLPSSGRRRLVRTSGSSVGMLGRASVVGEWGALLAAKDSRLERSNSSFSFLLKKPHL